MEFLMSNILVAYSTNSGSTAEVADTVADELRQAGHAVDVKRMKDVVTVSGYDAVVMGAPMIFGWHDQARQFVKKHQAELAAVKTAYFACAMSLTRAENETLPPVALTLDENLVKSQSKPGSLTLKERFTTIGYYLKSMLPAGSRPVSVAIFNGNSRCSA
jgi:menaquinone-dependent protoporphyrinogen IX oxidase